MERQRDSIRGELLGRPGIPSRTGGDPAAFAAKVNLKTAKALGLAVPDKLLAIADEVIE